MTTKIDSPAPIRYQTTIKNVREIALSGVADFGYWQKYLARQGFTPANVDGSVEVTITATKAKFMGLGFRELAIAVALRDLNANSSPSQHLAYAFNSSRLLAFAERTFFQTPYYPAEVEVEDAAISIVARDHGTEIFKARAVAGTSLRQANEVWEGALYLPREANMPQKRFFVRLSGATETYTFSQSDTLVFNPPQADSVFGWLRDSGFSAKEWRVRTDAVHARSSTYIVA